MQNKNQFGIQPKAAVYKIVNISNNLIYVGSSLNVLKRWNKHLSEFRSNIHHSSLLQNAWNKYGEDVFEFEVIKYFKNPTKEKLISCEQYWMDRFQSYERDKGYNICPKADSPIGIKRTEIQKQKIRETLIRRNQLGQIENGFKGKHHTAKTKKLSGNKVRLWYADPVNIAKIKMNNLDPNVRSKKLAALQKALAAMKKIRESNKK